MYGRKGLKIARANEQLDRKVRFELAIWYWNLLLRSSSLASDNVASIKDSMENILVEANQAIALCPDEMARKYFESVRDRTEALQGELLVDSQGENGAATLATSVARNLCRRGPNVYAIPFFEKIGDGVSASAVFDHFVSKESLDRQGSGALANLNVSPFMTLQLAAIRARIALRSNSMDGAKTIVMAALDYYIKSKELK